MSHSPLYSWGFWGQLLRFGGAGSGELVDEIVSVVSQGLLFYWRKVGQCGVISRGVRIELLDQSPAHLEVLQVSEPWRLCEGITLHGEWLLI